MTLASVQTATDAAPLTWRSVGGALSLAAVLVAILLYAAWATRDGRKGFVERWLENRFARRAARALDNGDARTLRAVVEMERTR